MTNETKTRTEADAVAEIVEKYFEADNWTLDDKTGQVLILPHGRTALSVEKFIGPMRLNPRRRTGVSSMQDLDSFIEMVNRFSDSSSAVFADKSDGPNPSLVAVFNYHAAAGEPESAAGFGDHRSVYTFPVSDEWTVWTHADGNEFSQTEFAEFIEERIVDVSSAQEVGTVGDLAKLLGGTFATPNQLLELSRGLAVREGAAVKSFTNLQSGEASLQYETKHTNDDGRPLKVPSLFLILIPVFESGPLYRIAVRLRYRVRAGAVTWSFKLYRPEKTFDHAFTEAVDMVRNGVNTPVFIGIPEKPTSPAS